MNYKYDAQIDAIDAIDDGDCDDYSPNELGDDGGGDIVDSIELLIADYLDDALSPEDRSSFERLVDKDESLRKRVEEERNAWNALDFLEVEPESNDLVETTVERLNAETEAEITRVSEARKKSRRRAVGVQVVASALLLLTGYFAFAAVMPSAETRRERDAKVVERLAQLEAVGDFEFLVALDSANLFDVWRAKMRENQLATEGKIAPALETREGEVDRPYAELAQDRVFYRLERRFEALPAKEQDRWRNLRAQIDAASNSSKLLRTLDDYNFWLATSTTPSDRERLDAMSTSDRVAEIRRKVDESNRSLDFFRKLREGPAPQGFPLQPPTPNSGANPNANPGTNPNDAERTPPPTNNKALSALRASLPDEIKNENLAPLYCQYVNFLRSKGGDESPNGQCEGIVNFLKESDPNCLTSDFSDCGKNYVKGLDESTKSTILGLLVSISFLEETERNRAPETRPFQYRPRGEFPQDRGKFGPRGGAPDFKMKGESVAELARSLQNARGATRDYITSCPAQEARGLLLGLHWGNWFGGRFEPVGMPGPPNQFNGGRNVRPPQQSNEKPQN